MELNALVKVPQVFVLEATAQPIVSGQTRTAQRSCLARSPCGVSLGANRDSVMHPSEEDQKADLERGQRRACQSVCAHAEYSGDWCRGAKNKCLSDMCFVDAGTLEPGRRIGSNGPLEPSSQLRWPCLVFLVFGDDVVGQNRAWFRLRTKRRRITSTKAMMVKACGHRLVRAEMTLA